MSAIIIEGGVPLQGRLAVQGAKNSALPLLAAALLCRGETVLRHCPQLSDVTEMCSIFRLLGGSCRALGDGLCLCADGLCGTYIPPEHMGRMRSSIVFLGALLGRCGEARLSLPGGCALGQRPIDLHLSALRRLGAEIENRGGQLYCTAPGGLRGGHVPLAFPSVGATENVLLAAATARGTTVLTNAACEPEIADLAQFLNRCGAKIAGAGEPCVIIEGVSHLRGCTHWVMPDRIAAATYLTAAAVTGGAVTLWGVQPLHLLPVLSALENAGCRLRRSTDTLFLQGPKRLRAVRHIRTMPYPGFPTDAQPLLMTAAALGRGTSVFVENIFENRFRHGEALRCFGARIRLEGKVAVVQGVPRLQGATVTAADLRGGAALVLAGLAARGESRVENPQLLDRGYEGLEEQLRRLGAKITRTP